MSQLLPGVNKHEGIWTVALFYSQIGQISITITFWTSDFLPLTENVLLNPQYACLISHQNWTDFQFLTKCATHGCRPKKQNKPSPLIRKQQQKSKCWYSKQRTLVASAATLCSKLVVRLHPNNNSNKNICKFKNEIHFSQTPLDQFISRQHLIVITEMIVK